VLVAALTVAVATWWTHRPSLDRSFDLFLLVFAGVMIFGYGFANLGIAGSVPLPLADVVLVVLVPFVLRTRMSAGSARAPFVLAVAFVGFAFARLVFDLPTWGLDALRDFTLPFEIGYLAVAYQLAKAISLDRIRRALAWILGVVVLYNALLTAFPRLVNVSPTVGLSHSVSLLSGANGPALVAAFLFFAIVRPFGRVSYPLSAIALALNAVSESRGLYVGLPIVLLLVWITSRRSGNARRGLRASLVWGVIALALLLLAAPQGRLGRVTPSFIVAQASTLWGRQGPGAGSLVSREKWIGTVRQAVDATPTGWAFGVGLGPDLAGGARSATGVLIRKPHNDFLEIFGRYGALGFILFTGFLLVSWVRLTRLSRTADEQIADFMLWTVGTGVIYAVIAMTQPLLAFPYGTVPLFGVLGLGLGYAARIECSEPRARFVTLTRVR